MAKAVILGQKLLKARLKAIAIKTPAKVGAALYAEAEKIMLISKRDYCPVASGNKGGRDSQGRFTAKASAGTLRASGFVNRPQYKGADVSVTLGYGGAAAPYAEALHEHPSGASPPSWNGKPVLDFHLGGNRHKYLRRPLDKAIPGMARRIAFVVF